MNDSALRKLVRKIHDDEFIRTERSRKKDTKGQTVPVSGAEVVKGWHERIREFSYAKSAFVCLDHVYFLMDPIREDLAQIVSRYTWKNVTSASSIRATDLRLIKLHAQTIHMWGGVNKKYGFDDAWKVIKAAVLDQPSAANLMDSGWTKVASLATDSLTNAQTIWDSRVSTSIVHRLDSLGYDSNTSGFSQLGTVPPSGIDGSGTRPRPLSGQWPKLKRCTWAAHFAGSAVVRAIVEILNDPTAGYPRMPQPNGPSKDWDVFGVGLVLFMDGY